MKDIFDEILEGIYLSEELDKIDTREYSPLTLAYVGDAVYEVYVRTYLMSTGKKNVHRLHKESIKYVKASSQRKILEKIMDMLTADEKEIVRRGRNANSGTVPKNADINDYRYATGFETLIGYLYLNNKIVRLNQIMNAAVRGDSNEKE